MSEPIDTGNPDRNQRNNDVEQPNVQNNRNNNPANNPVLPRKNISKPPKQISLEFENIPNQELEDHLVVLRQWLIKYNTFEYDNQSLCKLKELNIEDINIIVNHKTNFTKIKIFIDYLELELKCPNFATALRNNFVKYTNYLNFLTRKILLTSCKIKDDTSVFSDFILLNYPFIYNEVSKNDMLELAEKANGIVCFSKCTVIKVNEPTLLLWYKKEYPACSCEESQKKKTQRYFNILTKNLKLHQSFNRTETCPKCLKSFFHDTKSDIFLECQEVEVLIHTNSPNLVQNHLTVWAFENLINSVHIGDCITINTYYNKDKCYSSEKNMEYGTFVALNFNICFTPIELLKASNFILKENKLGSDLNESFIIAKNRNDNNLNENIQKKNSNLINTLQFQRQFNNNFFKFLIQNYAFYQQKQINCLKNFIFNPEKDGNLNSNILSPIISETYFPFLNIILDLSICQRDYYNHNSKITFLLDNNANYLIETDIQTQHNAQQNKNDYFKNSILTNSNNLIIKTKLFNSNNIHNNISQIPNVNSEKENDFKKYFRLCKQMTDTNIKCSSDLLIKPFNLFLIFDNTHTDPLFISMLKYANAIYKNSLIMIYPFFNQQKHFDKDNLLSFLYKANNHIVLIPDIDALTKPEIDIINSIMKKNLISSNGQSFESNISITFWFCCSCLKLNEGTTVNKKKNSNTLLSMPQSSEFSTKQLTVKGFENIITNCDIVMNFSKKYVKLTLDYNIINHKNCSDFINDINFPLYDNEVILTLYNHFERLNKLKVNCTENHYYTTLNNNNSDDFENSNYASSLIEEYFIKKRNITKISFEDIFSLLRMSMFLSMLRSNYEDRKICVPFNLESINLFDAILSIIIYEEVCGFKYGIENKNFNNLNTKIIFFDYHEDIIKTVNALMLKTKIEDQFGTKVNNKNKIPKSKGVGFGLFNFGGSNKKNLKDNDEDDCNLCREINKISDGRENLSEFLIKFSEFVYEENDDTYN